MPLRLVDYNLVNILFRSGKWKGHKDARCVTMRLCNVSTGHALQLIAIAIGCAGRASAQAKTWEFEVLMRDSGMSCVFARWLVTMIYRYAHNLIMCNEHDIHTL